MTPSEDELAYLAGITLGLRLCALHCEAVGTTLALMLLEKTKHRISERIGELAFMQTFDPLRTAPLFHSLLLFGREKRACPPPPSGASPTLEELTLLGACGSGLARNILDRDADMLRLGFGAVERVSEAIALRIGKDAFDAYFAPTRMRDVHDALFGCQDIASDLFAKATVQVGGR